MDIRLYMKRNRDDSFHRPLASNHDGTDDDVGGEDSMYSHTIPAKPRSMGLEFFPNSSESEEFVSLVGLEVVVQARGANIQDTFLKPRKPKGKGWSLAKKGNGCPHSNVKTCNKCSTDFTCRWWCVSGTDLDSARRQVCDQCQMSSAKEAMRKRPAPEKVEEKVNTKKMKTQEVKYHTRQGWFSLPKSSAHATQQWQHNQRI